MDATGASSVEEDKTEEAPPAEKKEAPPADANKEAKGAASSTGKEPDYGKLVLTYRVEDGSSSPCFGEWALLQEKPRTATVKCAEAGVV